MLLVEKMDEGPLIAYGEYELPKDITTPILTEHLIQFSDQLLSLELPKYIASQQTSPQSITGRDISYSRKLTKQDGLLDWSKPAKLLERQIRAFKDWPKSYTKLANTDVTVTDAKITKGSGKVGEVSVIDKQLVVHCGQDSISILKLIPSGKKEMAAEAFINGHHSILS